MFTAAGIIGSICSLEFASYRGRKRNRLLKWITILSFIAFLAFDLAYFFEAGNLKVAAALVGLTLSPIFLQAYESAFRTTKALGVGEVMSCGLINTKSCIVSAIQHFIVLFCANNYSNTLSTMQVGVGLIHLNLLCACASYYILSKYSS